MGEERYEFIFETIIGVLRQDVRFFTENGELLRNVVVRPYQVTAFENFITYFENDRMCQKPTQTLFHMATGSGKTLIMAGLMLYLYKKG